MPSPLGRGGRDGAWECAGITKRLSNHLIDHEIDLSRFDARYRNDKTSAIAYSPAVLLKVVLFTYSQGIIGSRLTMLNRHRNEDLHGVEPDLRSKEVEWIARLQREARQIREWLNTNPNDREGSKGSVRKSNRTNTKSAKMATSKGVIQGYCGVAAVDDKHQVIVDAQAQGTGSEQACLPPVITAVSAYTPSKSLITADAGYHSEANFSALAALKVDALMENGVDLIPIYFYAVQ